MNIIKDSFCPEGVDKSVRKVKTHSFLVLIHPFKF